MEEQRQETRLEGQSGFDELLSRNREYQSAFDRKVHQALQTARANWEREQAAALETARTEARETLRAEVQASLDQRQRELEEQEGAFAHRMRQVEVAERLARRGLPASFAPWLTGATEEECGQRVAEFETAFRDAISAAVTERMAGCPPTEPAAVPAYDRDALRGMSPREINAHWAEIQNALKG